MGTRKNYLMFKLMDKKIIIYVIFTLKSLFYQDILSLSVVLSGHIAAVYCFIWTYCGCLLFYQDILPLSIVLSGHIAAVCCFIWTYCHCPSFYLDILPLSVVLSGHIATVCYEMLLSTQNQFFSTHSICFGC